MREEEDGGNRMAPWSWLEPHGSGESESREWTEEVFIRVSVRTWAKARAGQPQLGGEQSQHHSGPWGTLGRGDALAEKCAGVLLKWILDKQ